MHFDSRQRLILVAYLTFVAMMTAAGLRWLNANADRIQSWHLWSITR